MIRPVPIDITTNGNLRPMNAIPILYGKSTWLAILYMGDQVNSRWSLYNLETGEQRYAPNPPRGFRFVEGVGVLSVIPQVLNGEALSYQVYQADNTPIILTNDPQKYVAEFAFSPDGQAVAYQLGTLGTHERDRTIYIWRNGIIGTVPQTGDLQGAQEFVWAKTTWIVSE